MKSCDEMFESVIKRRDAYLEKKRRRIVFAKRAVSSAACAAALFSGYMVFENVSKMPDKSLMIKNTAKTTTTSSSETTTETTAETTAFTATSSEKTETAATSAVTSKEALQSHDEGFTETSVPPHTSPTDAPVSVTKPTVTETSSPQTTAAETSQTETQTVLTTTTTSKTETSQNLPVTETVRTTITTVTTKNTAASGTVTTTVTAANHGQPTYNQIPWEEKTVFQKYDRAELGNGAVYYLHMLYISDRVSAEYYGSVNLMGEEYLCNENGECYDFKRHNEYVSAYIINGYSPEDCIAVWDDVNCYYGIFANPKSKNTYRIDDELEEYLTI